jgi:cobalt-precorrin-5B (C1)-methyltransferase
MSSPMPAEGAARRPLRYGWTTGACATAAAKAAYQALLTGAFPDPVTIRLPKGRIHSFALARKSLHADFAEAGVVKDAGDDPDVTHGALVLARVRHGSPGSGVVFRAGQGVGTVTKPGLPIPPGEPAINPVPREMMRQAIREVADAHGGSGDTVLEISIPGGEALAQKTWNPRLGIVNGLSILGTTGIVVPYSCAAWIHAIHRGIDVARALGHAHVAGSVGATSEGLVRALYGLPETALIDMGDFVGGMLKYLRRHPVRRLTIAGGFAKMSKLAQGHLDLHSGRSQVDKAFLAALLRDSGAGPDLVSCAEAANTGLEVLELARRHGIPLPDRIAREARETARRALAGTEIDLDVLVSDREGRLIGRA